MKTTKHVLAAVALGSAFVGSSSVNAQAIHYSQDFSGGVAGWTAGYNEGGNAFSVTAPAGALTASMNVTAAEHHMSIDNYFVQLSPVPPTDLSLTSISFDFETAGENVGSGSKIEVTIEDLLGSGNTTSYFFDVLNDGAASNYSVALSSFSNAGFVPAGEMRIFIGVGNRFGQGWESAMGRTVSMTFDNFQIVSVAPVPEPATTAALAGCGAFALVVLRRRRRAAV